MRPAYPAVARLGGRTQLADVSIVTDQQPHGTLVAVTRTVIRVACRACRRALVTDSWARR
jgi:hypothetical protein